MMKIFADKSLTLAGHGGADPGAVYEGRQEKDDNLKLALAVGKILEDRGVEVVYTRTDDVYQTPFQKATAANQAGADWLISFHRNSGPIPNQYTGVETLVYNDAGEKAQLARGINQSLANLGFRNIGVSERPGLVVLRRSKMPAVLIETGFINSEEDNLLFDEEFSQIAEVIAGAIMNAAGDPPAKASEVSEGMTVQPAGMTAQPNGGSAGMTAQPWMETGMGNEERSAQEPQKRPPCRPCPPCMEVLPEQPVYYRVQTGAFRNRENAVRQTEQLKREGYPAFLIEKDGYYMVQVGAFANLGNATRMEGILRNNGYQTYITT